MDEDEGKEPVSMGIRNDLLNITFQFDRKDRGEILTVLFPEL